MKLFAVVLSSWRKIFNGAGRGRKWATSGSTRVIFFGSKVKGGAGEDSGIGVMIVSEAFRCVPFLRRMEMVLKVARFPKHVDFLCYVEAGL